MDKELLNKYKELITYLSSLEKLAVAFSSGVDSTFLLYAAKEALGENAIAITAAIHSIPERELSEAKEYCKNLGIKHFVVKTNELEIEGFTANPTNRCYLCKKDLFTKLINTAKEVGIKNVAEGSNLDDNGDYRPGMVAIDELHVLSPLRTIGFTKQEIRDLSNHFNIPTWNKPSFACLSSRIPYGEEITANKLKKVELAEDYLLENGFCQFRVRLHGNLARIELDPNDFGKIMEYELRNRVYDRFKEIGFDYISLDLKGYRTGSLNETIGKKADEN